MAALAHDPRTHKVSAFIMFFSVLLLVEGVTRTNLNTRPMGSFKGDHSTFPSIVALVSAVGEIIFAFTGLTVGYFALVHGLASQMTTMAALSVELVFGWFVFVVYVLAMPAFSAARLADPMPELSLKASRAVILMSMTGSIAVCAALQGGQFMFTNILLSYISGKGKEQTGALNRGRLYFFAFLVVLKGVSEVVLGSILRVHYGSGLLAMPVVSPPYIVSHPNITIADGAVITVVGLIGLGVAGANFKSAGSAFSGLCLLALLIQLGLYDDGSDGYSMMGPPVGALQVILTTALMVMPAYLAANLAGEEPFYLSGKSQKGLVNGDSTSGADHV